MTLSVIIGGTEWHEFATVRGSSDFMRWADRLNAVDFPLVVHFADWGWVYDVQQLADEISRAMDAVPPMESVRATLDNFRRILSSAAGTTVMLTNGMSSDEDRDEDEWWVDGEPELADEETV
jgi:hypothetical protein